MEVKLEKIEHPRSRFSIHQVDKKGNVKIEIWNNYPIHNASYMLSIEDIDRVIECLEMQKKIYAIETNKSR